MLVPYFILHPCFRQERGHKCEMEEKIQKKRRKRFQI